MAGVHKNGVFGDGNNQLIEVLPPRSIGINKTYTIQVALDGKNFIEVPSVKLTVLNDKITEEENFRVCGKEQYTDVITIKHVDAKTGKNLVDPFVGKGYLTQTKVGEPFVINEYEAFDISAKEIPGYKLVEAPDPEACKGYLGTHQELVFKYEKVGSGSGSGTGGNTGTGGQSGSGNNGQNDAGNQNKKPVAQNTSATTNNGKVAKTGDTAPILPIAAVAVISLAGVAVVFKKKREVK